jgi:hypothetical protein
VKLWTAIWLLSLAPVWAQMAKPASLGASANPPAAAPAEVAPKIARVPLQTISELEHSFNNRLRTLADVDNPVDLLGDTRGLQLDNYGIVFTTEVSLVVTPNITPFRPAITPELAARVHKNRVERMPLLIAAMKEMMRNMAAACPQIPANQRFVLAVRLYYGAWEDTGGMPAQVMMKADRDSAAKGLVEPEQR